MKTEVVLASTDCSQSRTVKLEEIQRMIRLMGGFRETSRGAVSLEMSNDSTNVVNVFDDKEEYVCAVGWKPGHHKLTGGLFICG